MPYNSAGALTQYGEPEPFKIIQKLRGTTKPSRGQKKNGYNKTDSRGVDTSEGLQKAKEKRLEDEQAEAASFAADTPPTTNTQLKQAQKKRKRELHKEDAADSEASWKRSKPDTSTSGDDSDGKAELKNRLLKSTATRKRTATVSMASPVKPVATAPKTRARDAPVDPLLGPAYVWSKNSCWLDSGLQLLFVAFTSAGMDDLTSICANLSKDSVIRTTLYVAMESRRYIPQTTTKPAISKALTSQRDAVRAILKKMGLMDTVDHSGFDSPFVSLKSCSRWTILTNI